MHVIHDSRDEHPFVNPQTTAWHPALQPMRRVVEHWHARGDPRAWPVHTALAICAGHQAFRLPASAHQHCADDVAGESADV